MKLILLAAGMLALTAQNACKHQKAATTAGYYKGRLEKKGICSNYTIKLLEGNIDTSLIAASWKNEENGRTYTHVFGLDAPCSFPAAIKEGEEFYFTINTTLPKEDCIVCMAYYPTPPKKLAIKVVEAPDGKP